MVSVGLAGMPIGAAVAVPAALMQPLPLAIVVVTE
jgi:hypothetical protein